MNVTSPGESASLSPFLAVASTCFATAGFGCLQNRGGLVGGPISLPKILYLNFTLIVFVVLPFWLWRNAALMPSVRALFGWVFLSFAVRGVVELYIIYCTRRWKCIYGILHDLLTLALVIGLQWRWPSLISEANHRAAFMVAIVEAALVVECFMAWKFSQLASPADGVYFAADTSHFKFINRVSWAVVGLAYPLLGYFLWVARHDFFYS